MVNTPETSGNAFKPIDKGSDSLLEKTREMVMAISKGWFYSVQGGIEEDKGEDPGTRYAPVIKSMLEGPFREEIQKTFEAVCQECVNAPGCEIPIRVPTVSKLRDIITFFFNEPLSKLPGLSRPDVAFNLKFIDPKAEASV